MIALIYYDYNPSYLQNEQNLSRENSFSLNVGKYIPISCQKCVCKDYEFGV